MFLNAFFTNESALQILIKNFKKKIHFAIDFYKNFIDIIAFKF